MSADDRKGWAPLGLAVLLLAYGVVIWWPISRQTDLLAAEVAQTRAAAEQLRVSADQVASVGARAEALRARLETGPRLLGDRQAVADFRDQLESRIAGLGLASRGVELLDRVARKGVVAVPIDLSVEGDSLQVLRLVRQIEQTLRLVAVERLEITRETESTVIARLRLRVYHRAGEEVSG